MHLISKNRYPITNNPALETIVGYLLEAPKIVRDLQPMQWQFLDAPADGTLILTWQPTEQLGTNFASDGYVYGDVEQSFKSDVRGYVCGSAEKVVWATKKIADPRNVSTAIGISKRRTDGFTQSKTVPPPTVQPCHAQRRPGSVHCTLLQSPRRRHDPRCANTNPSSYCAANKPA